VGAVTGAFLDGLIKRGANINFRSGLGTALTQAVYNKSKKMIELLLSSGADPNLTTSEADEHPNLTPLEYARALKLKPIVALLEEKLGQATQTPALKPMTWPEFVEGVTTTGRSDLLKSLRGIACPSRSVTALSISEPNKPLVGQPQSRSKF